LQLTVFAVHLLVVEAVVRAVCVVYKQVFDQRLDNQDSTINQLESTWQQLIDAGYLSDEDSGKRQVCMSVAVAVLICLVGIVDRMLDRCCN